MSVADLKGLEIFHEALPEREDFLVLKLAGEFDSGTCQKARAVINDLLEDGKNYILVDLLGVEYINSSGFGVLIEALKKIRAKNGKMPIICANPHIIKVFEISGLFRFLPVFTSRESFFENPHHDIWYADKM